MPEVRPGEAQQTFRVLSSYTDCFQNMKLSVLLRMLQESAIEGTENAGVTREYTLDKGLLWVVSSLHFIMQRPIRYDETITITSWPGEMRHVFFPRHFTMEDKDHNVIMQGIELWLLMDAEKRTMVNPKAWNISIPGIVKGNELSFPSAPKRLEGNPVTLTHEVSYSELDLNGHVNNSVYMNWIDDMLGKQFHETHFVSEITAAFHQEVHDGEIITLEETQQDDDYAFLGTAEKGKFFQASLHGSIR